MQRMTGHVCRNYIFVKSGLTCIVIECYVIVSVNNFKLSCIVKDNWRHILSNRLESWKLHIWATYVLSERRDNDFCNWLDFVQRMTRPSLNESDIIHRLCVFICDMLFAFSGRSDILNVEREFAQLDYFLPLDAEQEFARKECNQQFNRSPAVLPCKFWTIGSLARSRKLLVETGETMTQSW